MDTFSALIALAFSRATTDENFMGYRNPGKTLEIESQWSTLRPFLKVNQT